MSDIPHSDSPRAHSLGELLRSARERQGLELADISEVTNVRREYLIALEEGRYLELPEDVYTRNFLRLYAQAVEEEPQRLLDVYTVERGNFIGPRETSPTEEGRHERIITRSSRERPNLAPWFSSLLLIAAVVLLALWGFNATLFNPGQTRNAAVTTDPTEPPPVEGASAAPDRSVPAQEAATTAFLTVITEPSGAEVSVDAFPLAGVTPIENAPVTALESRQLLVTLEGFEPYQERVNLSTDLRMEIALVPVIPLGASDETPLAASRQGTIAVTITETTWLEVYQGTARNEGERLVYATAEPGEAYEFDLPVYIHVGNGAGVQLSVSGQDLGPLGEPGEVLGRAFPLP